MPTRSRREAGVDFQTCQSPGSKQTVIFERSIGGFAVWAFAGKWFYVNTGEAGLYAASTGVFTSLAGLLMHPLILDPRPLTRFYRVFVPAFFAYAIVWCGFWFLLRFGAGEWLASLAGSAAFVAVSGWRFGNLRSVVKAIILFFVALSLGYFAGGKLMYFLASPEGAEMFGMGKAQLGTIAKLSWGALFGLGFGAGLGYAYYTFQQPDPHSAQRPSTSAPA
ncbi:MAG: hypothetical protein ABI651_03715 [Verrucomicrobiota bacterium]